MICCDVSHSGRHITVRDKHQIGESTIINDSVSAQHARQHHGGKTTVIAMLAAIGITVSLSAATLGTHTATAAE